MVDLTELQDSADEQKIKSLNHQGPGVSQGPTGTSVEVKCCAQHAIRKAVVTFKPGVPHSCPRKGSVAVPRAASG